MMSTKTLFWISLFLLLFVPSLPLLFFSPYLVACCYRFPPLTTLWRVLVVSIFITLISSSETLGIIPLTYCFATLLLFLHTRYFFADKWSTLPIMTYLFSFYASLFYIILLPLLGTPLSLSLRLVITEIFLAPLFDTLLAGIVSLLSLARIKKATA